MMVTIIDYHCWLSLTTQWPSMLVPSPMHSKQLQAPPPICAVQRTRPWSRRNPSSALRHRRAAVRNAALWCEILSFENLSTCPCQCSSSNAWSSFNSCWLTELLWPCKCAGIPIAAFFSRILCVVWIPFPTKRSHPVVRSWSKTFAAGWWLGMPGFTVAVLPTDWPQRVQWVAYPQAASS